jgi:hypothetical protein
MGSGFLGGITSVTGHRTERSPGDETSNKAQTPRCRRRCHGVCSGRPIVLSCGARTAASHGDLRRGASRRTTTRVAGRAPALERNCAAGCRCDAVNNLSSRSITDLERTIDGNQPSKTTPGSPTGTQKPGRFSRSFLADQAQEITCAPMLDRTLYDLRIVPKQQKNQASTPPAGARST